MLGPYHMVVVLGKTEQNSTLYNYAEALLKSLQRVELMLSHAI